MKSVLKVTLAAIPEDGAVDLYYRNTDNYWCVGNVKPGWMKKRMARAVMERADTIVEMAQDDPDAIVLQPRNIDLRRAWQKS